MVPLDKTSIILKIPCKNPCEKGFFGHIKIYLQTWLYKLDYRNQSRNEIIGLFAHFADTKKNR